jgi:hypothetical protein
LEYEARRENVRVVDNELRSWTFLPPCYPKQEVFGHTIRISSLGLPIGYLVIQNEAAHELCLSERGNLEKASAADLPAAMFNIHASEFFSAGQM